MSAKEQVLRELMSVIKETYSVPQHDESFHDVDAVACGLMQKKQTDEWAFLIKIDGIHFVLRHDSAQLKAFAEEVFTCVMRLEELRKHASTS